MDCYIMSFWKETWITFGLGIFHVTFTYCWWGGRMLVIDGQCSISHECSDYLWQSPYNIHSSLHMWHYPYENYFFVLKSHMKRMLSSNVDNNPTTCNYSAYLQQRSMQCFEMIPDDMSLTFYNHMYRNTQTYLDYAINKVHNDPVIFSPASSTTTLSAISSPASSKITEPASQLLSVQ